MKIVLSEGKSQADFLIKLFQHKSHKLIVINNNKQVCEYLTKVNDIPIYFGDSTKKYVLEEAGVKDADIFIALSHKDEENFVACKIAKEEFQVKRTVSIVSNPKDVDIFMKLGIDSALSSTYLVSKYIEKESLSNDLFELLNIDNNLVTLTKLTLTPASKQVGVQLKDLKLALAINISAILRNDNIIIPDGNTTLKANDILYIVSRTSHLEDLHGIFEPITKK